MVASKPVVLVVEDEPLLLMYAADIVASVGCEVIEARNADEAIEILETRTDVRVVFTDVDMPGSMNGIRLAAVVRDRWPPVEIIVISGYRSPSPTELPVGCVFISKPYDERRIVATVANFLS